jgi:hypothetical protein
MGHANTFYQLLLQNGFQKTEYAARAIQAVIHRVMVLPLA